MYTIAGPGFVHKIEGTRNRKDILLFTSGKLWKWVYKNKYFISWKFHETLIVAILTK